MFCYEEKLENPIEERRLVSLELLHVVPSTQRAARPVSALFDESFSGPNACRRHCSHSQADHLRVDLSRMVSLN